MYLTLRGFNISRIYCTPRKAKMYPWRYFGKVQLAPFFLFLKVQQQPFFHNSSRFGVITPKMLAVGVGKQTCWGVLKYSANLDVDVSVRDSASCPREASGWWCNIHLEASGSLLRNVMHLNNPFWLMGRTTREEDNPSRIGIG